MHLSAQAMRSMRLPSAVTDRALIPLSWLSLPRTERQARSLGKVLFFNATPCTRGHFSIRRIGERECPQCAHDRARELIERRKVAGVLECCKTGRHWLLSPDAQPDVLAMNLGLVDYQVRTMGSSALV